MKQIKRSVKKNVWDFFVSISPQGSPYYPNGKGNAPLYFGKVPAGFFYGGCVMPEELAMGRKWNVEDEPVREKHESDYCVECGVMLTEYEIAEFGDTCGVCMGELKEAVHPKHPDNRG